MPHLMFAGEKVSPVRTNDDHWQEDWGFKFDARRALATGHKQDAKFAPKRGTCNVDLNALPPLLPLPYWLCTNEIRDLIESFEPGKQVFLPYEIHMEGNPSETVIYNLINFCEPERSLDVERCDPDALKSANRVSPDGYDVYTLKTLNILNKKSKIFFNECSLNTRHIWNDVYTQDYSNLFISDEFYNEFNKFIDEKYISILRVG